MSKISPPTGSNEIKDEESFVDGFFRLLGLMADVGSVHGFIWVNHVHSRALKVNK